jgi:hypothetical protein
MKRYVEGIERASRGHGEGIMRAWKGRGNREGIATCFCCFVGMGRFLGINGVIRNDASLTINH